MAARSIASLSISFGLVSIPVKLYTATESSSAIRFRLMGRGGVQLRQQYVADAPLPPAAAEDEGEGEEELEPPRPARPEKNRAETLDKVVAFPSRAAAPAPEPEEPMTVGRSQMVKGYEFEKGRFVLFTPEELKALEEQSRQTIDIVSFVPAPAVDPIYYDKPYFLAPDKRGAKPYHLLKEAMLDTGRCALGKWAWRSKEYVVQIRPAGSGMVLQQLLYADEVRSIDDLQIEQAAVADAELKLAVRLIEQIAVDSYDPGRFVDEEKLRILAAVERKIAGHEIVAPGERHSVDPGGGTVLDLMSALKASLHNDKSESAGVPARKPMRRKTAAAPSPPRKQARR